MTTSRTRKSTAASKAKEPAKAPEPMDDSVEEVTPQVGDDGQIDVQAHAPFSDRNCWSIEVLLAEVKALYPEATHYISERTGRGVGVAVTFEGADSNHPDTEASLSQVLACVESDERVAEVTAEEDDQRGWVSIRMYANPVTMDTRDEFGLSSAYDILSASDD